MMSLPREHFSIQSMEDAAFFLKEYIPAGKAISCRDVMNAGRGYSFERDGKGEISAMKVHYGDDSVRSTFRGENAVALAFEARDSINSKWFLSMM